MRIGVYNRHLATLGGGERYMLKIAELLGQVADVDIVSQAAVPASVISDRLGIDVSELGFVALEDNSVETAELASEKYDLFINASHLDPVKSRAAASILLVHFPSATTPGLRGFIRRALADRVLRPFFSVPVIDGGFDLPETSEDRWFTWTFGDGRLTIPSLTNRPPRLRVPLASFRHDGTGPVVRFRSGDEEVAVVQVPAGGDFHEFLVTPTRRADGLFALSIESDTFIPPGDYADARHLGVAVGKVKIAGRRGRVYDALFERMLPDVGQSLYGRKGGRVPEHVHSYSSIWTVSRFVQDWTRRYWGVSSSLINPPVDVEGIQAYGQWPKENVVLNVGRFFSGSHNKKHLEMIAAFRRMLEQGLSGWTLVLVGSVSEDPGHQDYLRQVREAAEGLPVRVALDISYDELVDLYARSSIYWHATGFGESERRDPAAMEHFGITTVEAMAAGCVPIVIRKAGQAEIVRHQQDGLLWRDLDQLVEHTWSVVRDPGLRGQLAKAAAQRSQTFSQAIFERRLKDLVSAVATGFSR